jgi:hypothetical protein
MRKARFSLRAEVTDIEHQLKELQMLLGRLGAPTGAGSATGEIALVGIILGKESAAIPGESNEAALLRECRSWLHEAIHNFAAASYFSYYRLDLAYSAVREVRQRLCLLLPPDELCRVALDVREDLDYVEDATQHKTVVKEWTELNGKLRSFVEKDVEPAALRAARAKLRGLSLLGSSAREVHWRRVNLLRGRLLLTTLCVTAGTLAMIGLYTLYGYLVHPLRLGAGDGEEPLYLVFAVAVAGAIGGFISALWRREPLSGDLSAFYRERMFLWLRPFVGATTALVLYLAQISGAIVLLNTDQHSPAFYLFVAFGTGFSEKFFLGRLEVFLKQRDRKKGAKKAGGSDEEDE